jgi:broad-specificity NMP kinase
LSARLWQDCASCGALDLEARPVGDEIVVTCVSCGHEERRRRLPFFSVTGATCSGKSSVCRRLWRLLPECVSLDGDLLWDSSLWNDTGAFYARWLGVAAQISQSGRPVVLCTAAIPEAWEKSSSRVLVGDVHMLALVCDEDVLLERLRRRGRPQDPAVPAEESLSFNRWLRANVEPALDTTSASPDDTAVQVVDWVRAQL